MAKLTKAEAARQMGISRTTLYKLIHAGTLSVHPDGTIDTAELVRAVSTLAAPVHRAHLNVQSVQESVHTVDSEIVEDEQYDRPQRVQREHREQVSSERHLTSIYQDLVDTLREQLQAAREREHDYQARITWLEHQVDQVQQRYDRLLDAPRPAQPAPATPSPAPLSTPPPGDYRGFMRQRVLQALQGYPQGRTKGALEEAVGASRPLTDVLTGMYRDGLLVRVARGRYALPVRE